MDLTPNQKLFREALVVAYRDLFDSDPDFAWVRSRMTPEALADKMLDAMIFGTANHTGLGFRRACKAVGIKHTRAAIRAYLAS